MIAVIQKTAAAKFSNSIRGYYKMFRSNSKTPASISGSVIKIPSREGWRVATGCVVLGPGRPTPPCEAPLPRGELEGTIKDFMGMSIRLLMYEAERTRSGFSSYQKV